MPEMIDLSELRTQYAIDRDRAIIPFGERENRGARMQFRIPGRRSVQYTEFHDRISRCETHHRTVGGYPEVHVTYAMK